MYLCFVIYIPYIQGRVDQRNLTSIFLLHVSIFMDKNINDDIVPSFSFLRGVGSMDWSVGSFKEKCPQSAKKCSAKTPVKMLPTRCMGLKRLIMVHVVVDNTYYHITTGAAILV